MIEHAPKKERSEVRPRSASDSERRDDSRRGAFPASDPSTSTRPQKPLWDQYPETD